MQKASVNNSPTFGAYFSNKNAIHLKRLCKSEFNELSRYRLKDRLDWFAKELPNHELEITQFESLSGVNVMHTEIPISRRSPGYGIKSVITDIMGGEGRYTITNKNTDNSINVYADNIFEFLEGIKKESEILFSKTKNSLTEGLNEFSAEIINKLTTKQ